VCSRYQPEVRLASFAIGNSSEATSMGRGYTVIMQGEIKRYRGTARPAQWAERTWTSIRAAAARKE